MDSHTRNYASTLMVNCNRPISYSVSTDCDQTNRRQFQFYDIRQCHLDKLACAVNYYDWSSVTGAADIDDAYNLFLANVQQLIHETIPCHKVTLTKSTPPHITPLVKSLLRRRNKLRRKGRIEAANELSTKIGNLIAEFRATHLQRLNNSDIRRLWATVKPSLGKSRKPSSLSEMYGDSFADLDKINEHFAGIATDPNYDLESITAMKPIISGTIPHYRDITCEYEVYKILSTLKKTSPGIDGVPYWVYKHCAVELAPVLTHLINTVVKNGTPPSTWLKALVTPVPKRTPPTGFSDLRPISVTPILSRVTERLIVHKYLLPALPSGQILDQFAYKPTGSTTAALIAITHHISRLLESSSYVRCILIDYSKAFDSINHSILFQKLLQLNLPPNVLLWIINFLSSRTQAVSSFGQISGWLPISQSIIQGSGIGPYLYMLYASDLRTLSPHNVIVKYADDTTLLVGQYSSVDISQEYENICSWSATNRLTINTGKTKEIVFHRPASRHLNIPPPLPDIERVTQVTLLGIDITSTLSTSAYVNRMLMQTNQRLYLLSQLKSQGMNVQALHTLFTGLIMSKITYALPAFAGQLTADDRNRIGAISRKAQRRGVSHTVFDIDELMDRADRKLFTHITKPSHCLHHLLPSKTSAHCSYSLRKRQHCYQLPHIEYSQYKNSFINHCLFNFR